MGKIEQQNRFDLMYLTFQQTNGVSKMKVELMLEDVKKKLIVIFCVNSYQKRTQSWL